MTALPALLAALIAGLLAASTARADDHPVLLPGAPLVMGQPGTIELWAPDLSPTARLRGRCDLARIGAGAPAGDGRWLVPVTPTGGGVDGSPPHDLTVTLSLKDEDRREEWTVTVPVRPDLVGAFRVEVSPPAGETAEDPREVIVHPLGSSPVPPEDRRLLVRSRIGRLGPPSLATDGWHLSWRPPTDLETPAWDIITLADARAPTSVIGWAAVPVVRPVTVTAEVRPGARCRLTAGEVVSEPTVADRDGRVAITIDLHPAVARGELRCTVDEDERTQVVSLPAGQGPTVALLPLPDRLPGGARVPVQAVVIEDDGSPRTAGSGPTVDGVGPLQFVADGLYSGTWTVPTDTGSHTLTAHLLGSRDDLSLTVVRPGDAGSGPPATVVAWADPPALPSRAGSVVVQATALDAAGLPIPRTAFTSTATGGRPRSNRVVAGRDGRAAVRFTIDDGPALPSLRLDAGGGEDTAVVLIADPPLSAPVGSGPDPVRQARAILAGGGTVPPTLLPASVTVARAAAGDSQALSRVDEAPARLLDDEPWLRLSVAGGTVPHTWSQSAVEGDHGIPGRITSRQGDLFAGDPLGAPGVDVRARVHPDGLPVGADLRVQARSETYHVIGTSLSRLDLQLAAGIRAPVPLGSRATPFALAQVAAFRVPLFSYDYFREDDPTKAAGADMIATTVVGARLGGGVDLDLGDTLVDVELSETFAPWPIDTRLGLAVDHAVIDSLALRAAIELSVRSMEFDLGVDRARVFDQQHQLVVGLVYLGR